ncbi:MAG TPA: cyclic nucleotide-binding domain-containing protein [Vicinamibacterales bacterium]|jgi:CRP-like cAMP-binding protein
MQIETLEPILAAHPFLQGLDPSLLALIVGCASNVRFDPGQYLFREGQEANEFFIIRHGRVSLEIYVPDRGPVTLQTISAGGVLGWSWVFPPYRWHSDARATELTRAIALDGTCLRKKCEDMPSVGYELMKRFARVLDESLQASRLQLLDVYGHRGG